MRLLVTCEKSGAVRNALRALGHDAYSNDILPSDDNSPFHIIGDALGVIRDKWDGMIAHPECTYLAVSGIHWNYRVEGRAAKTDEALAFAQALFDAAEAMHNAA